MIKQFLAICFLSILAACGNESNSNLTEASIAKSTSSSTNESASTDTATLAVDSYRPQISVATQESPLRARDLAKSPTPAQVTLTAATTKETTLARKNNEARAGDQMGKPLQIGFSRNVAQTSTSDKTQQILKWTVTSSGSHIAAINFNSIGAKGTQIGLLVNQIPDTATLRFFAKGEVKSYEVKGSAISAIIAKNIAAGDKSDAARTYWAPMSVGENAIIEIELPAGVNPSSVSVSVPKISHIFMTNKEISASPQLTYSNDTNVGLYCQVDIKCSSPMPAATDAVAHLSFIENGGSYICSGTLLNDTTNSSTPYLLTANHCISSQTVASTLTSWFKYRALTCNDGSTGEKFPTYGGADLLYTAYATDSTLVRLLNTPAVSGVLYAGWDATTPPAVSTTIHTVHHPQGDQQRLSRGSITEHGVRDPAIYNEFYASDATNGTVLGVILTTGLTEGGSSGSAIFKGTDSNPKVIGQLWGGAPPSCGTPKFNIYGRFDVAYKAGMHTWLDGSTFYDVPSSSGYWSAVENIVANGITLGCNGIYGSPRLYCPKSNVTRAQMAVFLLKAKYGGSYVPPAATGTVFADVQTNTPSAAWIERVAAEGITVGCNPGQTNLNYCPTQTVTRAQMAVFLLKTKYGAAFTPAPATGADFIDVNTALTGAATSYIERLRADNVTQGCNGNVPADQRKYCPTSPVTREAMATFLVRNFGLVF